MAATPPRYAAAKKSPLAGAGAFVLHGMGHAWSAAARRLADQRLFTTHVGNLNLLRRPAGRGAAVIEMNAASPSGGFVALDMAPAWQRNAASLAGKGSRLIPSVDVFHRLLPDRVQDLGIDATRSLLVDFADAPVATVLLFDRFKQGANTCAHGIGRCQQLSIRVR